MQPNVVDNHQEAYASLVGVIFAHKPTLIVECSLFNNSIHSFNDNHSNFRYRIFVSIKLVII